MGAQDTQVGCCLTSSNTRFIIRAYQVYFKILYLTTNNWGCFKILFLEIIGCLILGKNLKSHCELEQCQQKIAENISKITKNQYEGAGKYFLINWVHKWVGLKHFMKFKSISSLPFPQCLGGFHHASTGRWTHWLKRWLSPTAMICGWRTLKMRF